MATGDGVLNYNGRRWTKTLVTGAQVNSVSCVTADDCFVVDATGTLYHWASGRWTTGPDPIVSNVTLSCKTSSFCAGVATNGDGLFYAPVPLITTTSLPSGRKGAAYSARLRASGGTAPYRFKALAGLPRGLKVAPNGAVSGTPKVRGHFSVKVAVTDPLGERSTRRLKISVS